jgi:hypothetical protein
VGDVLSLMMWVVVVWLVMFVVACTIAAITLRRSNRVVRSVPSDAPITWLVSPSKSARLHRQLRNLGMWTARSATAGHDDAWQQILNEIVATDARLVVAARAHSRVRSVELDGVAATVQRLEDLAVRLSKLDETRDWPQQPAAPSDALEVLEHRIENLEAAHVDLADLERRFNSGGSAPSTQAAPSQAEGPSTATP